MKITDIKTYPTWVGHRNQCLVKVETDTGLFGWGEAGVSGRELAVDGAVRHFREFLLGRDPMLRGALWQQMYRSQYFEGGRVLVAAISAIDIALHDIAGKALGVPVHQLLGGRHRDVVPCFTSVRASDPSECIEKTRELAAAGWQAIRAPTGRSDEGADGRLFEPRESIGASVEMLVKLREAVGPALSIGVDYHHRLSVAEAASFCQRLPRGTLDFVEEPIRDECPEAYESLRGMTEIPFAIGEEFASKWAFLPYLERGLTNYARLDVCNVGGFTESMKVAGWAEAHYVDLMPHNPLGPVCTAASVHLAAAVANFSWLEVWLPSASGVDNFDDELFPVRPRLEGPSIRVPDAPGLGIEVNEDLVRRQSFTFWEAPHWHRRDGSYTNW
jgi:galactonate dehydratase